MSTQAKPPFEILIIVTPDFNLAATTAFIDPFRAANYLEGKALFRWHIAATIGGEVTASNGLSVSAVPLDDTGKPDLVVISSSWTPERYSTASLHARLHRAASRGAKLCALDTGAFIMADAGLLAGRRATVHYEHIDAFSELYPDITVSEDLFVDDDGRLTCCGGEASADLALHIIRSCMNETVANAASRYIFHPTIRGLGASQLPPLTEPLGGTVPGVVRTAIRLMEANLETPFSIPEISQAAGVSQRQLNRLFARHLCKTTALYYRDIRLDRARGLVTQTAIPLTEVAFASGFRSQVTFSRAYRRRFGLPPGEDRTEGRIPFEFRAWPMHRPVKD
ncbi:MAG: GlxA family transcriptional regulator [Pseudomonadota bacterium]